MTGQERTGQVRKDRPGQDRPGQDSIVFKNANFGSDLF
jgi:hypothetical protein